MCRDLFTGVVQTSISVTSCLTSSIRQSLSCLSGKPTAVTAADHPGSCRVRGHSEDAASVLGMCMCALPSPAAVRQMQQPEGGLFRQLTMMTKDFPCQEKLALLGSLGLTAAASISRACRPLNLTVGHAMHALASPHGAFAFVVSAGTWRLG